MREIPVKQISELLVVMSETLPKLAGQIMQTLYSEQAGEQMGKAVAAMYRELIHSGMEKEVALRFTKDYLETLKQIAREMKER
jgi:hypothetical protein